MPHHGTFADTSSPTQTDHMEGEIRVQIDEKNVNGPVEGSHGTETSHTVGDHTAAVPASASIPSPQTVYIYLPSPPVPPPRIVSILPESSGRWIWDWPFGLYPTEIPEELIGIIGPQEFLTTIRRLNSCIAPTKWLKLCQLWVHLLCPIIAIVVGFICILQLGRRLDQNPTGFLVLTLLFFAGVIPSFILFSRQREAWLRFESCLKSEASYYNSDQRALARGESPSSRQNINWKTVPLRDRRRRNIYRILIEVGIPEVEEVAVDE